MINVFVGYDSREDEAFQVCRFSLTERSSVEVKVYPIKHKALRHAGLFNRGWRVKGDTGQYIDERDGKPFSTEFSHSRFLVPDYAKALGIREKWVLFCDCDFLFLEPVERLFELADDRYAVMVCKHNHCPSEIKKMDGVMQTSYPCKNWSSLILWNLRHPLNQKLNSYRVNTESGSWLHQFKWLPEDAIGALPLEWNWIEGAVPGDLNPSAVHYSVGGPWFDDYRNVKYADKWVEERSVMRRELWKAS